MYSLLKINKDDRKLIFYYFFIGLLTHGFMIFNKFSLNDDNDCLYRLGLTYPQGRWLTGFFDDILNKLGTYNYSLPAFNGFLTILLIALSAYYICKIFDITDFKYRLILGAILETVIEVAAFLGFMFLSWCYALGILLSIVAAWFCIYPMQTTKSNYYLAFIGIFLLACSLGLYQAFLSVYLCIILIYLLLKYSAVQSTILKFIKEASIYCLHCIASLLCYFLINKLFLLLKNTSMTNYQNMNSWGVVGISQYKLRILNAYEAFFIPNNYHVSIFPELIGKLYPIILVMTIICLFTLIRSTIKKKLGLSNTIIILFLSLLFPLTINFNYLLSDVNNIHSAMIYSSVFTYVLIISVCQKVLVRNESNIHKNLFGKLSLSFLLVICILYARIDNILYLKAYTIHENDLSYLTTLITRVTSTNGYNQSMPLYLYKLNAIDQNDFYYGHELDAIVYLPYYDQVEHNQDIVYFMNDWCGYNPQVIYTIDKKYDSVIDEMNCYPDDNSIRIVDNVIIIKFSN